MIFLPNTTDKLRLATTSAAAVDVSAMWVDGAASTLVPSGGGRTLTKFSSATTTDIVPVPGASTTRTVKHIEVRNTDALLSVDVTVLFSDNGTTYELRKETLSPGWQLTYIETLGWFTSQPALQRSGLRNVSVADQSIGASTTAYLTGSAILLPTPTIAGTVLRWTVHLAKTAAATATTTVAIRFGTGASTSDTARNSFTTDTETAVADEAVDVIRATIRGPITSSCIVEASFQRDDNLTTTGFSNTARKSQIRQATSAAFDITPAGTYAGLSIASGASHALTVRQVIAEYLSAAA